MKDREQQGPGDVSKDVMASDAEGGTLALSDPGLTLYSPVLPSDTEEDLILKAAKGNEPAFAHLMSRYQARILNFLIGMVGDRGDAEDLTQEVFIKAYYSLPKLKNPGAFRTWLFRIAHNLALDHARRRRLKVVDTEESIRETYVDPQSPEQAVIAEERRRYLHWALNQLDPPHREVLVMCDLMGMSYQEIADILGIPFGTVQSRIFYARRKLRNYLDPLRLGLDAEEES